jgi:hypothetical protein
MVETSIAPFDGAVKVGVEGEETGPTAPTTAAIQRSQSLTPQDVYMSINVPVTSFSQARFCRSP